MGHVSTASLSGMVMICPRLYVWSISRVKRRGGKVSRTWIHPLWTNYWNTALLVLKQIETYHFIGYCFIGIVIDYIVVLVKCKRFTESATDGIFHYDFLKLLLQFWRFCIVCMPIQWKVDLVIHRARDLSVGCDRS